MLKPLWNSLLPGHDMALDPACLACGNLASSDTAAPHTLETLLLLASLMGCQLGFLPIMQDMERKVFRSSFFKEKCAFIKKKLSLAVLSICIQV